MEKWQCKTNKCNATKKKKVLVLEKTIGKIDTVYEGKKIYIIRDTYSKYDVIRILITLFSAIVSFLMGVGRHNETSILWFFISLSMIYTLFLEHRYIKVRVVLAKDFEKKYSIIKKDHNVISEVIAKIKNILIKKKEE